MRNRCPPTARLESSDIIASVVIILSAVDVCGGRADHFVSEPGTMDPRGACGHSSSKTCLATRCTSPVIQNHYLHSSHAVISLRQPLLRALHGSTSHTSSCFKLIEYRLYTLVKDTSRLGCPVSVPRRSERRVPTSHTHMSHTSQGRAGQRITISLNLIS